MCQEIKRARVHIRKGRNCFGCETPISKGATLWASTQRGDGRLYTIYLCNRCFAVSRTLDYGQSYGEGELRELWNAHELPYWWCQGCGRQWPCKGYTDADRAKTDFVYQHEREEAREAICRGWAPLWEPGTICETERKLREDGENAPPVQ